MHQKKSVGDLRGGDELVISKEKYFTSLLRRETKKKVEGEKEFFSRQVSSSLSLTFILDRHTNSQRNISM